MIRAARTFAGLAGDAAAQSAKDNVARMAAALAYYSLFALAPILFIALTVASYAVGSVAAEAQLRTELDLLAGPTLASAIEGVLGSYHSLSGPAATAIGLAALAVGGSGIFLELRESLDAILGRRSARRTGIVRLIKLRTLAFAMVLLGSTLLLAGMAASVAFAGFLSDAAGLFPQMSLLVGVAGTIVLLALSLASFALLYRQMPRPKPAWREAWVGAAVAAVLFVAGEFGLSVYLGRAAPVSPIGAAGSVFALLVWVYYSAQIAYFGAEFAKAYGLKVGLRSTTLSP
jgi:membrane protein